jgi:putative oxidoreductase
MATSDLLSMSTTGPALATKARGKGWHIGLWVAQVLLAIAFGMAGFMKLATPYADLVQKMAWVKQTPEALVKFIGVAELAGALGLILPAATRIKPFLTPLAATGFIVIMVLAIGLHLSLGEMPVPDVILGGIAAFIAWGRWRRAPISPRNGT